MSNPNFVNDLVMMAKAYEELPGVKADLDAANTQIEAYARQVQNLEMRLIDRANELDAAHAATHKAEVERDHAETMFLETDDRLNAFKRLVSAFQTDVGMLTAAAEPVVEVKVGASEEDVAIPSWATPEVDTTGDYIPKVDTPAVDQSAADPTASVASDGLATTATLTSHVGEASESIAIDVAPSEVAPTPDPTGATTPISSDNPTGEVVGIIDAPSVEAALISVDDVGYHNEPDYQDHASWDAWLSRMNARYGIGQWPSRYPAAAQ